jgi:hypothetical protein
MNKLRLVAAMSCIVAWQPVTAQMRPSAFSRSTMVRTTLVVPQRALQPGTLPAAAAPYVWTGGAIGGAAGFAYGRASISEGRGKSFLVALTTLGGFGLGFIGGAIAYQLTHRE